MTVGEKTMDEGEIESRKLGGLTILVPPQRHDPLLPLLQRLVINESSIFVDVVNEDGAVDRRQSDLAQLLVGGDGDDAAR